MIDVAHEVERQSRSRRIAEQIMACGTSVGANTNEADEALSRADFCKCIGIAIKELNECRFWIRLAARRAWLPSARLTAIQAEALELKLIYGAMLSRTRAVART
jgi:four helix bundle protein